MVNTMDNHGDNKSPIYRKKISFEVNCVDSQGNWRNIKVVQEMPLEEFLPVVCYQYDKAARFILNWASNNMPSAAEYMARFLTKVFSELNLETHYLKPKHFVETSFGIYRPSVSMVSLRRFCELLNENPVLITQFRNHPLYPLSSQEDNSLFAHRENNYPALTRGVDWDAPDFLDPSPIPDHLKQQYAESQARAWEALAKSDKIKPEIERKKRQEIKLERFAVTQLLVEQRKKESSDRKHKRGQFLQNTLPEQLCLLVDDEAYPVEAFPFDPGTVTKEMLVEFDDQFLEKLTARISGQRKKSWKDLKGSIDALRNSKGK
jgi:hypothetical protein